MLNFLIVLAIIGQFIAYELVIQAASLLGRRRLLALIERLQRQAVRKIFSTFACYRGWKPELENRLGQELPERFLIVANHQSLFDIPIVWRLLPERHRIRFVAKSELAYGIPFVSSCLRLQGHALVRRKGDMIHAMKSLERFAARSRKQGFCPVLFPEGTRSRTGELGPFHTAGFRKLIEADPLPVLVAAIEGGSWVAKLGDLLRNVGRYSYKVRLVALLPAPKGKKDILATLEKSRELVAEALEDMRKTG